MKINEIFYSLQGEGHYAGTPAVFIRLSGCNLNCPFCDTEWRTGEEMTDNEIVQRVKKIGGKCRKVVLTGGEPTMQDVHHLIALLHQNNYWIAMETNGSFRDANDFKVDFITLSPKDAFCARGKLKTTRATEVKVVMNDTITEEYINFIYNNTQAMFYYIQPCDMYDTEQNEILVKRAIDFVKKHPDWRLSLQTQKILKIQ